MPLLSVIIPNYNHETFLERRIKSVLNQTFQDFELILLDDASTDNSKAIIEKFRGHAKVSQIIYNAFNGKSPYKQWKKGIDAAKGQWIWIAESDDDSDALFLESLKPAFFEKDCVMAFSEVKYVRPNGDSIFDTHEFPCKWWKGKELIQEKLLTNNAICNSGMVVFRKSNATAASEEFTSFILAGDWLLWCRIAMQGTVFYSGLPYAFFTKHSGEFSEKYLDSDINHKEHIIILEELLSKKVINLKKLKLVVAQQMAILYNKNGIWRNEQSKFQYELWDDFNKKHELGVSNIYIYMLMLKDKLDRFFYRIKVSRYIKWNASI